MDGRGCAGHAACVKSLRKACCSILVKSHPPFVALSNPVAVKTLPIFPPLLNIPIKTICYLSKGKYNFIVMYLLRLLSSDSDVVL